LWRAAAPDSAAVGCQEETLMSQSISNPFSIRIKAASHVPVPAWVPPPGFFADVPMTNFPKDVAPAIYASDGDAASSAFIMWGGSAWLRDYSALGAQVYYSGGHEAAPGLPNIQYALICDFSSLRWSTANVPLQMNPNTSFVNGFAPDGTPYCPHTYLGLQEWPSDWGGGAKGSLLQFFFAGNGWERKINVLDVARPTLGYSVFATRQPENADPTKIRFNAGSGGDDHPITVLDEARQGWWTAVQGTVAYTLFIHRSGLISQYPALGGNLANGSLVLVPSMNLLLAIDGGYRSGQYAGTGFRTMHVRNLSTGAVSKSSTLGTVPSLGNGFAGAVDDYHRPDVMGLQWVEEFGCIVGLDQMTDPPTLIKLSPPASDPANKPWTWSSFPALQHWAQDGGGQPVLQKSVNNLWSKFRWVPTLQAFVYATAKDRKPQVLRIA
jgi:hypothetical protein